MSGGIFVSYRRGDSPNAAGRLYDHLIQAIERDSVFIDVDGIAPGLDFVEVLSDKVGRCDVLLAVIGPRWGSIEDEQGRRRLDLPDDFVRIEITAALERNVRVIPVLVEGARMPTPDALPETLKGLSRRQAFELTHDRFRADSDRLSKIVRKTLDERAERDALAVANVVQEAAAARIVEDDRRRQDAAETNRLAQQKREDEERDAARVAKAAKDRAEAEEAARVVAMRQAAKAEADRRAELAKQAVAAEAVRKEAARREADAKATRDAEAARQEALRRDRETAEHRAKLTQQEARADVALRTILWLDQEAKATSLGAAAPQTAAAARRDEIVTRTPDAEAKSAEPPVHVPAPRRKGNFIWLFIALTAIFIVVLYNMNKPSIEAPAVEPSQTPTAVFYPNGDYKATMGWDQSGCPAMIEVTATVRDSSISFTALRHDWTGKIDQSTGDITINNRAGVYITGTVKDGEMTGHKCTTGGYFKFSGDN